MFVHFENYVCWSFLCSTNDGDPTYKATDMSSCFYLKFLKYRDISGLITWIEKLYFSYFQRVLDGMHTSVRNPHLSSEEWRYSFYTFMSWPEPCLVNFRVGEVSWRRWLLESADSKFLLGGQLENWLCYYFRRNVLFCFNSKKGWTAFLKRWYLHRTI